MNGNQAGFTLLELLIGLALLGLLYVLLFDGLHGATLGWRRVDAHLVDAQEFDAVADLLRLIVSRTQPEVTGPPAARRIDFIGAADRLEFLAPLPERFGATDIVRWQLFVENGDLVLSWRLDRQPAQDFPAEAPARTLLLKGVQSLAIGYFGVDRPDLARNWREDWQNRLLVPSLIRIRLTPKDARSVSWSDLIIAPRLMQAADCQFDPADMAACRVQ